MSVQPKESDIVVVTESIWEQLKRESFSPPFYDITGLFKTKAAFVQRHWLRTFVALTT